VDPDRPLKDSRSTGKNAWLRMYEQGVVLVNPSSREKVQITLPHGHWQTLSGSPLEQELTLEPASGMIVIKGS
jgi:hypothetical protein